MHMYVFGSSKFCNMSRKLSGSDYMLTKPIEDVSDRYRHRRQEYRISARPAECGVRSDT